MYRQTAFAFLLTLVACVASACGASSPTGPSTPAAVAPTISTSADLVLIGQTVPFEATGGGTIKWGGDSPSVANIDTTTGRVTGVGTGRVTIWAENAGGRTTRLLRVLPSYNGTWSGSYTLQSCQSVGDYSLGKFCGQFFQGQVLSIAFNITQNRDAVSGTFALGSLQGTLNTGVVNEDGSLPLSGIINSGTSTVQLSNLRATSPSAGTMRGSFDQIWSSSALSGTGRLMADIRDVTRTSGAPSFTGRASGTPPIGYSLEEMIRGALARF